MDTTQEINKIEQAGQDSFEAPEIQKSENLLASFLGDCNEEERKVIDEFSQTLGIRTNDAIWAFVKIFFTLNRANNNLPKRITDALDTKKDEIIDCIKKFAASAVELETKKAMDNLSDTLQQVSQNILNQHRKNMWLYDFFLPLACVCLGIFLLCLISFIGGAAIAGKGWGHSPLEALLNAPAGWILPLALIPVGGIALFRGLTEQGRTKYLNLLAALIVAVGVLCVLAHIL